MTHQPTYLTQEGEKRLRAELAELTGPRREELSQRQIVRCCGVHRRELLVGDWRVATHSLAGLDQVFIVGRWTVKEREIKMFTRAWIDDDLEHRAASIH